MCNPVNAYHEAVKKYKSLAPEDIAARSGAVYDADRQSLEIEYFGSMYMVNREGMVRRRDNPCGDVPYNDRTLIVQYLSHSSGLPPRGRWLSFLELPDGIHHHAPFQTDALRPLAEIFGNNAESFSWAAGFIGGRPAAMGDYSFIIPALPKIPLAVLLWEGDDEFQASSNILFDSVASAHLTTAALWVLGVELARKMIAFFDESAGREKAITWLEGVKRD